MAPTGTTTRVCENRVFPSSIIRVTSPATAILVFDTPVKVTVEGVIVLPDGTTSSEIIEGIAPVSISVRTL